MIPKKLHVFLFNLAVLFTGCTPSEFESAEALDSYIVSKSGLSQMREANGYQLKVTYRPTDLLISQEISGEPEPIDSSSVNRLRKKYRGNHYFLLSISRNNSDALHDAPGGMARFTALVQTLAFRMDNYVGLTTSAKDSVHASASVLDRTYAMTRTTDILFAFNKDKTTGKDWVQFNIGEFGLGTGNLQFRFSAGDLERPLQIRF